jgi:poly(A) polymerase
VSTPLPSLRDAAWLQSPATQAVLASLSAGGFEARVVGGAVRNALCGRPVADVDIATTATPGQVIERAARANLKSVATGLKHGTVTVIAGGQPFEVTTLRRDVETDGRHATVAFTDDWVADASRRDLTLNALYCDAAGTIFDPLGGVGDLMAGRVRFIGDARARIREDYLRILRFFRFTAEYADGPPDADGIAAAVAGRDGLARLSAERVRAELLRLLVAPRAVQVIETMAAFGLLTALVPVAPRTAALARLVAIESGLGFAPDAALRLAVMSVAVAEDAVRLARHLRLSAAEHEVMERAAMAEEVNPAATGKLHRTQLYRWGKSAFRERVLMAWVARAAPVDDPDWRRLIGLPDRWAAPKLPITGRDLMARGMTPGPRMGEVLAALETWWITSDFPDEHALITAEMDRLVRGA